MGLSRRMKVAASVFVFATLLLTLGCERLAITSLERPAARQSQCAANLREISDALASYHEEHGRYPPAYVSDSKGVPMHSWRVLLLKYLDKELYDLYDFDEPWDGPKNKHLLSKMPAVYACPNNRYGNRDAGQAGPFVTDYLALVGPHSPFQPDKSKSMSEIFVGSILIAEVADSGILWMEPRDLDVSQINPYSFVESLLFRMSSRDPSGPGVILGDLKRPRLKSL